MPISINNETVWIFTEITYIDNRIVRIVNNYPVGYIIKDPTTVRDEDDITYNLKAKTVEQFKQQYGRWVGKKDCPICKGMMVGIYDKECGYNFNFKCVKCWFEERIGRNKV